jgi:glycerophosphoryl diester phosphodiesterase
MSHDSRSSRGSRSAWGAGLLLVLCLSAIAEADAEASAGADDGTGETRPRVEARYDHLPAVTYLAYRGGGAAEEPEGALSSLRTALTLPRISALDVDVRALHDGTPVSMHDRTMNRTTDVQGPVATLSRADWSRARLDPATWFGYGRPPEPPPTLDAALDAVGGLKLLNIEVKDAGNAARVIAMVKDRRLEDVVLLNTRDLAVARQAHTAGLHTHFYVDIATLAATPSSTLRSWRTFVDVFSVDFRSSDADISRATHSGFQHVWAYSLNRRSDLAHMLALGVDGAVLDAPRYVLGVTDVYPVHRVYARDVRYRLRTGSVKVTLTARNSASYREVPGVRVTVSLDGHSVRARTNRYGKATVSLPRPADPGTYSLTLRVTGNPSEGELRWTGSRISLPIRC